jgi:hypothetical protein
MGRLITAVRERLASPSLLPYLCILAATLPAILMVWLPGYPRGADTWGHLFKSEYLAGQMRANPLAYFTSAWMPDWYMGDPYRTYYPPLTTLVLAPLVYLFRDPFLAYRIFVSFFLILYPLFTYRAFIERVHHWTAAFAAVLVLWSPYTIRTLFFEGNLPRVLCVLALPWLAYFAETTLIRSTGSRLLLGSLTWAWAILAHVQQALMFAIGIGLYTVVRLILDTKVPVWRLLLVVAPIALGAAVSAPWTLPAYSRLELTNIPYLPPIKVDIFSAPLSSLLPSADPGAVMFGLGVLALALLSIAARPEPRRIAWLVSGLFCLWFALGPAGVAFSLLPAHDQLLPERFTNFSAFAIPITASGLVPLGWRVRYWRIGILAALILLDALPVFPLLRHVDYPFDRAAIAARLAEQPDEARVVLLTYPEPTAIDVYFASNDGAHDQTSGWALENTPHHPLLRRALSAPEWGPEYFARLMSLWNVRYAVVSGDDEAAHAARSALASAGYANREQENRFELWVSDRPASPIQSLPREQLLIVGDQPGPMLAAYPFGTEGPSPELADYSPAELDSHPVLALMRFATPGQVKEAESLLRDWVSKGNTAIVDLSGMEEPFSQGLDFLGVNVLRLAFQTPMPFIWQEPLEALPNRLALPEPAWNGAAYRNLDVVYAEVEHNETKYSVLGYKNVGAGRVWFVGLNLLFYAQTTGARNISSAITILTLDGGAVSRQITFEAVPTESASFGDGRLEFVYDALEDTEALISFTYSPRWEARVDDQPIELRDYEHLMRLSLPAGRHTLTLTYQPYRTWPPRIGLLVGVLTLIGLVAGVVVDRRLGLSALSARMFTERRSRDRWAKTKYAPCPNCGFRFSEVAPPLPETYPFDITSCPVCGQRFDQNGFRGGGELTLDAREAALNRWLMRRGYEPGAVDPERDFKVPNFFAAPEEIEEGTTSPTPPLPPLL